MYGYSEYNEITLTNILERVSQEDIFEMVLGYVPVEYSRVRSPLRDDPNPGCFFSRYDNKLRFVDFGDEKKHRDCIDMVQDMYKLSFWQALQYINNHFKLGLGLNNPIDARYEVKPIIKTEKTVNDIEFKPRDFNDKDRIFWTQYGITKQNLIDDGVFPLIWYKVYSRRLKGYVVIRPSLPTYAYTGFSDTRKVKIYSPYTDGIGKWMTNCDGNDIGNIHNLSRTGRVLVITKSYKDCRVLRNFGVTSVWFQNEGMFPDMSTLRDLIYRFKKIVIFFDNDETGIRSSTYLAGIINKIIPDKARGIHLPVYLYKKGIKDPSDLVKIKGEKSLTNFLTKSFNYNK